MAHLGSLFLYLALSIFTLQSAVAGEWDVFHVHWQRIGLTNGHPASGIVWADEQLGLGFSQRGAGLVVLPEDSVPPYEHLTARMQLVSRVPGKDYEIVLSRQIRDKSEYLLGLGDIEQRIRKDSQFAGSVLNIDGPPERRIIHLERTWEEKERKVTVKMVNGVKLVLSNVVRDVNGDVRMVQRSKSQAEYVRYEDKLLIHGRVPDVFEIPHDAFVRPTQFAEDDSTHVLNVEDIPNATRENIWNAMAAGNSVALQQYDNEDDATYAARRLFGENRVDLLRSAFFDIDRAWVSLKSGDGTERFRWRGGIDVRQDTDLSSGLASFSRRRSRLKPLNRKNEVGWMHWCSRIPQPAADVLTAASQLLEARTGKSEIPDIVRRTINEGVFEFQLRLQAEDDLGVVGIGNIRIENLNAAAQDWLYTALASFPTLQVKKIDGQKNQSFLQIRLPDYKPASDSMLAQYGLIRIPEYAYLRMNDSELWFAVGGDNAWRALDEELERPQDDDSDNATSDSYLLKCRLDLESANWSDNKMSPLASLLEDLERRYSQWNFERMAGAVKAMGIPTPSDSIKVDSAPRKYKAIVSHALKGRTAQAELIIYSDANGVRAECSADAAFALIFYGRMMLASDEASEAMMGPAQRKTQTVQDLVPIP